MRLKCKKSILVPEKLDHVVHVGTQAACMGGGGL